MPTTTPSPLDTLEEAFDALTSGPQPLALDGTAVGCGLPARPVPLDELRELLLDRSVSYAARDAAIGELLRRAKSEPAWIVGLAGVLLPGLRRIAGRVAREFPGDTADVDAEILAGFVEAVRGVEACGPRLAARLLAVPWNRAKVARRAEMACAGRKVPAQSSAAPVRPWGHPDLVLDRAVAAGAVTHEEAEIIGATRLGGAGISIAAGDLDTAAVAVLALIGMSEEEIEALRASQNPDWSTRIASSWTLPREARAEESWTYQPGRFDKIEAPTLLLTGTESPPDLKLATRRAADAIPGAQIRVLDGHGHLAPKTDPVLVADVIRAFSSTGAPA